MVRFGRFLLRVIDAGMHALDGGALFGIVPKPLWERSFPADAQNRVDLSLRLLLLEAGSRRVLVDSGIGNKFTTGGAALYKLRHPEGFLNGALAAANIEPVSISDVIVTHGHFDHAGGLTSQTENDSIVPALPQANVHIQRRAYEWALSPSPKDMGSFHASDLVPLATAGKLDLLDGPKELFDGVRLVLAEGHTVGQQLVMIDGGEDGKLLCCADLMPTAGHLNLPWISAHDLYPLASVAEKERILSQAAEENWVLFFGHDPAVAMCRVANVNGRVAARETYGSSELDRALGAPSQPRLPSR